MTAPATWRPATCDGAAAVGFATRNAHRGNRGDACTDRRRRRIRCRASRSRSPRWHSRWSRGRPSTSATGHADLPRDGPDEPWSVHLQDGDAWRYPFLCGRNCVHGRSVGPGPGAGRSESRASAAASAGRRLDATTADPPRQAGRPQEWGVVRSGRQALPAATVRAASSDRRGTAPVTASKNCGTSPCGRHEHGLAVRRESIPQSFGVLVERTTDAGCPGDWRRQARS